ncbi:MAG TPA: hypothetical protein VL689_01280 [Paraburkholderia sp.]|nr:hypothetical protein [Paraburkholderia sp.]
MEVWAAQVFGIVHPARPDWFVAYDEQEYAMSVIFIVATSSPEVVSLRQLPFFEYMKMHSGRSIAQLSTSLMPSLSNIFSTPIFSPDIFD